MVRSMRPENSRYGDVADIPQGLVTIGSDNKVTPLPDFTSLSKQIASNTPSGPNSASYSPTNSAQACPTMDSTWEAASSLPPAPNTAICECMVSNLTCVAQSKLDAKTIAANFGFICDPKVGNFCEGVTGNGMTGVYGAYSMCDPLQRLSWAYNQFYLNQTATNTKNTDPCDFSGAAQKVTPSPNSACKAIVSQAGSQGTGVITNSPTATGAITGGSAGSTSSHKGAAGAVTVPAIDFGLLKLAAYLSTAFLVGAGFVLL